VRFVGMLGMHGTLEANLAMHHADLAICVGARFDDRVTSTLADFSPYARKIHVDISASQIDRVVKVDAALAGDCGVVLEGLLELLPLPEDPQRLDAWWQRIAGWRERDCLAITPRADTILPQQLMTEVQAELQGRDVVVSTDVGQHQMWAAQYLRFDEPRRWLTSGGAAPAPPPWNQVPSFRLLPDAPMLRAGAAQLSSLILTRWMRQDANGWRCAIVAAKHGSGDTAWPTRVLRRQGRHGGVQPLPAGVPRRQRAGQARRAGLLRWRTRVQAGPADRGSAGGWGLPGSRCPIWGSSART